MPPGESHVSRISKEYYVNYFNSSHRELGPPVVWSSRLHKLIDCSGGVWETADSLSIALRITSNNAPRFRNFLAQESHRHTVRK